MMNRLFLSAAKHQIEYSPSSEKSSALMLFRAKGTLPLLEKNSQSQRLMGKDHNESKLRGCEN